MPDVIIMADQDAYVDSAAPGDEYGLDATLELFYNNGTAAQKNVYVRFPYPGNYFNGIAVTAALYLYQTGASGDVGKTINIYRVTEDDWEEATINFTNQPDNSPSLLDTYVSQADPDNWVEVGDVADAINDWLGGEDYRMGLLIRYATGVACNSTQTYTAEQGTAARRPRLDVHYNRQPYAPDRLSPASGESTGDLTPTISGRFRDADTEDTCTHIEVAIYESDGITLKYDSGAVALGAPVSNGGTFTYDVPSAAALEWGLIYKYKVRVRDQHNASNSWSPYSAMQTFAAHANPEISDVSPGTGDTVYTTAPLILWNYIQVQDSIQKWYRVRIYLSATDEVVYDSGIVYSALPYHQCPIGTIGYGELVSNCDSLSAGGTWEYVTVSTWKRVEGTAGLLHVLTGDYAGNYQSASGLPPLLTFDAPQDWSTIEATDELEFYVFQHLYMSGDEIKVRFYTSEGNYYEGTVAVEEEFSQFAKYAIAKGDFVAVGAPDWNNIAFMRFIFEGTGAAFGDFPIWIDYIKWPTAELTTTYYTYVQVSASNDLTDEETTGDWSFVKVNPPTGLQLTPNNDYGNVLLEWANDADCVYSEIYYRKYGETEWELIHTTANDTVVEFTDWSAANGTVEYAIVTVDADGYKSNPEDCKNHCELAFVNWFLSNNDDESLVLELFAVEQAPFIESDNKIFWKPLGRGAALADGGESQGHSIQVTCTMLPEPHYGWANPTLSPQEQLETLKAIRETEYDVWLKSNLGHRFKVSIGQIKYDIIPSMLEAYRVQFLAVEVT